MTTLEVVNLTRRTLLGTRVALADSWWPRFRGLLGRDHLGAGEGILLRPCRSIHMRGMRFPVDVAFLDRDGRVVAVYPALEPRRFTSWHRAAREALEVPAGTLEGTGTRLGDRLAHHPVGSLP